LAHEIRELIESKNGCIATDKITVDGLPVNYMYKEEPYDERDSGWRFFSGTETQEYVDDANNSMIYKVNTIANYDPSIIPYLDLPIGTELEKDEHGSWNIISQ
jgi:hypothetical protein